MCAPAARSPHPRETIQINQKSSKKLTQKNNSKTTPKSTSKRALLSSKICQKNALKTNLVPASLSDSICWCSGGGSKLKNVGFTYGKPMFLKSHPLNFGSLFNSKMGPFWLPNRPNILQKSVPKLSRKCYQILYRKWNQKGTKMNPKWLQKGSKMAPKPHTMTPRAPKSAQEHPKSTPEAKMTPKALQNDPKSSPKSYNSI